MGTKPTVIASGIIGLPTAALNLAGQLGFAVGGYGPVYARHATGDRALLPWREHIVPLTGDNWDTVQERIVRMNIQTSDATIYLAPDLRTLNADLTARICRERRKPLRMSADPAEYGGLLDFLSGLNPRPRVLNIAGQSSVAEEEKFVKVLSLVLAAWRKKWEDGNG